MAKEITGYVKLQIKGGQANPAPPVGPALGQRGINIMEFCKAFNEKTKAFMGKPVPVVITVYKDKKFDFIIKSPPASHFIREAAKLKSGSSEPGRVVAGSITMKQAEAIAKEKMKDLNAFDLKEATKIICGSARSMGIEGKRIMKKRSKRYKKLLDSKSKEKIELKEVFDLLKKNSTTKFDESIDVSLRINLKQSKGGDLSLRTVVKLPNSSGKKEKVAVLCEPDKLQEAKSSGADIFGSDDLIEKISAGKFDFTKLICTPAMMGKIGKHGKVLGPKGLMPNPKLGTVTNDITKTVKDIKTGLVEIRNDKDGNLASTIGRKSFSSEKLLENYKHFIDTLKKEKPETSKGEFIKSIFVTSTMGISYKVGAK